ncbi:MAG: GHMP kinase [Flavobacteriaceae bacterium]|nr:GHMP kinase [Flavobacteriaceae bacterium]
MKKIRVPSRICLFGDHQDYLNLPVIAAAIDRYMNLEYTPTASSFFKINLIDLERTLEVHFDDTTKVSNNDYFRSCIEVLKTYGFEFQSGYELNIHSDIPINAGLSSSSALVVSWLRFLVEVLHNPRQITISDYQIGRWAYESEVLFFQQPGGCMDQFTIANSGVIYIDTLTQQLRRLPKPKGCYVIANSGISKDTLTVLAEAKKLALSSIEKAIQEEGKVDKVTDFSLDDYHNYLHLMTQDERPYWFSTLENYRITLNALKAMTAEHSSKVIGSLLNQHQYILKKYIKNTPEIMQGWIDGVIQDGALGAKIIGSGGGGCLLAVCNDDESAQKIVFRFKEMGAKEAFQINLIER